MTLALAFAGPPREESHPTDAPFGEMSYELGAEGCA